MLVDLDRQSNQAEYKCLDASTVMKLRGQSHGSAAPWVGMRVVWQSLKLKVFPMNVSTVAALVLLIVNDSRVLAG